MRLIGIHEIAQSLGVTRQRADQLSRRDDFPKPYAELQMGRIWREDQFAKWQANREKSNRGATREGE